MNNLKEMILQEQQRLETIRKRTEAQLKNAPEGCLCTSSCGKWIQYYHYLPGNSKNKTYLSKTKGNLIQALAQKSYDEKVADYEPDEIDQLFLNENREKQKLIRPAEPVWEQQLEKWAAEEYVGKNIPEDSPVIITEKGDHVRSKSEKILADFFYRNGILYKYECPLYLKEFGTVYPDFTFLSPKYQKEIYWEHHGLMDDPTYAQNAVRKIHAYEKNDIFPGERLILTFETAKTILDTQLIEQLVYKYLEER